MLERGIEQVVGDADGGGVAERVAQSPDPLGSVTPAWQGNTVLAGNQALPAGRQLGEHPRPVIHG